VTSLAVHVDHISCAYAGNDALDGLLPATNTSSSTRQQQQRDEPLKPTSSQHSKKHS